jgi:Na+-transporting NADH:ubiquinone oxidoreductase subunit NqrC
MSTLIIISLTSLVTSVIVIGSAYRLFKANQQQQLTIARLQNQVMALTTGAVGLDQRVYKFEQTLGQLREQHHKLDMNVTTTHNYDQAIRLARKGVEINQLIDNCNLSDEEAHLISRLYGGKEKSGIGLY